jgi:hypothetical protein
MITDLKENANKQMNEVKSIQDLNGDTQQRDIDSEKKGNHGSEKLNKSNLKTEREASPID